MHVDTNMNTIVAARHEFKGGGGKRRSEKGEAVSWWLPGANTDVVHNPTCSDFVKKICPRHVMQRQGDCVCNLINTFLLFGIRHSAFLCLELFVVVTREEFVFQSSNTRDTHVTMYPQPSH